MRKRVLGIALVALLALTAAASVAVAGHAAKGTVLRIKTDKILLKYNVSKLKAKAGKITIVMTNISPLPHDVAIKGHGVHVKGKTVGKGGQSRVTVTLKKGTYEFYCTLPGHEAAGMKGTLTVT
ncbi:MAG TPA: plastocyanin/azurin family copper-binding protein [Gaiellaceae bacterium]|nr:plastocyanin/azurin family copper-binding protein [Gaiellaceae bacterium]